MFLNSNIWDVFCTVTDGAECNGKVSGAIRSLVNVRDLQIECASLA